MPMDSDTEQRLRDSLQPMIRDELMRSWHGGVQAGLKMARNMAEAVRNEAAVRSGEDCTVEQRASFEAQIAALGALMSALDTAAAEAVDAG